MVTGKLLRLSVRWKPGTGIGIFFIRQGLGILCIIIGLILAVPGIPGPGLVVVFLGILLLDFPGKVRLIHRLGARRWFRLAREFLRKRMHILLEMNIPQDP